MRGSLGEMLTLSLLALHGNLIRAETVLLTPMKFKGCKSSALLPIVAQSPITWFIKDVPKQNSMVVKEPQVPRHICYDRDSIPAAYSVFELMAIIRERSFLSKIEEPLLIMQSKLDPVIHPFSAKHIVRRISSPSKELVMLEDCYHTITGDKERKPLADRMNEFFTRYS